MQRHHYPKLAETLFSQVLSNGLSVQLLPKAGYHKTYAVLTTNYGAIDQTFVSADDRKFVTLPAGMAHFLEHKMFEKKDHDAFDDFARFGASANAFTSYTQTSYLFSTTHHLKDNLMTLLDFVQSPYFTPTTVEKEKGIIGQEIQMYDDDPNSRAYFGTIANLYPDLSFKDDIAGSLETIETISANDLSVAYNTFYQPSNMSLFVVGRLDPIETLRWIETNQSTKSVRSNTPIIRTQNPVGSREEVVAQKTLFMPIERPKVSIGLRGFDELPNGRQRLKYEEALVMGFDLLFGEMAPDYLRLYDAGILDDSFGYNVELQRGAHFVILAGETDDPKCLIESVLTVLKDAVRKLEAASKTFEMVKREALGATLAGFNSLEGIANQYDPWLYGGTTIFDELEVIESVVFEDVLQTMTAFIDLNAVSTQTILPSS